MGHKGNKVTFPDFRAKAKDEQRESILSVASMCWDGAPVYLARWLEIYFEASPEDQKRRREEAFERRGE